MQHDWNFYEAQVAARLTKGFLYRITELVNLPSSRQKNSLFSFSNRYSFSSHSDHSVAATASLKQLAVPVFHKHAQNNAYRGNLVEPIQCWLCWRFFFDGGSNHDLSQSGKRSFYLFFFFGIKIEHPFIASFVQSLYHWFNFASSLQNSWRLHSAWETIGDFSI